MNWYPQFGAGSIAQFPLSRTRKWRAITNRMENDERVLLVGAASREIEWKLRYQELSDAEVRKLTDLFAVSRGVFGAFGFIDPTSNLLGWSEDLSQPDWNAGLLGVSGGAEDPAGTARAWTLTNWSGAEQQLQQSVGVPGEYNASLSVWLWSNSRATVKLRRDGMEKAVITGPRWTRGYVSGYPNSGSDHSGFSISVPAGTSIRMWGPQVEAQPYPSQYKPAAAPGGVYQETYFGTDELNVTCTGPGLSSCDVTLVSRG